MTHPLTLWKAVSRLNATEETLDPEWFAVAGLQRRQTVGPLHARAPPDVGRQTKDFALSGRTSTQKQWRNAARKVAGFRARKKRPSRPTTSRRAGLPGQSWKTLDLFRSNRSAQKPQFPLSSNMVHVAVRDRKQGRRRPTIFLVQPKLRARSWDSCCCCMMAHASLIGGRSSGPISVEPCRTPLQMGLDLNNVTEMHQLTVWHLPRTAMSKNTWGEPL